MVPTKMIAQIMSDQRQKRFQRRQQAGQHKRIRSGIKNFEERIHNKTFKMKQLVAVPQNVQVKKNGQVVQRMAVRRRAIFPPERQRAEYQLPK